MTIATFTPFLVSLVFGLVVAIVEMLIADGVVVWRHWLARAFVYMCFCYIILFGVIKV